MRHLVIALASAAFLTAPSTCPADGDEFLGLKRQFDYDSKEPLDTKEK